MEGVAGSNTQVAGGVVLPPKAAKGWKDSRRNVEKLRPTRQRAVPLARKMNLKLTVATQLSDTKTRFSAKKIIPGSPEKIGKLRSSALTDANCSVRMGHCSCPFHLACSYFHAACSSNPRVSRTINFERISARFQQSVPLLSFNSSCDQHLCRGNIYLKNHEEAL